MYQYQNQWGQYPQTSHIQNISAAIPTEVQCFYANNPQEMEKIPPQANVIYIGINLNSKEIYLRQTNGMGLIDIDTYVKQSGEQQKSDTAKILEKLDELKLSMKGKDNVILSTNGTIGDKYVEERTTSEQPDNTAVQSNDSRTDIRTEAGNNT